MTILGIYSIESFQLFDHFLLIVLSLVIPLYSWKSFEKNYNSDIPGEKSRLRLYAKSIALHVLIGIATLTCWILSGRKIEDLGFKLESGLGFLLAAVIAITIVIFLFKQLGRVRNDPELISELKIQMESLKVNAILPSTKAEFRWFILLSCTAGIFEEIAFRGFMISYWSHSFGGIAAILISSITFGFYHLYQGHTGVLQTAIGGLINGTLFVISGGSLLFPIALHIAMDINGGALGFLALRSGESSN